MCSTFYHCIVYNPKGINTKGWLVYQSFHHNYTKDYLFNLNLVSEQNKHPAVFYCPTVFFPSSLFHLLSDFSLTSGSLLPANIKNVICKFLPFLTIKNVFCQTSFSYGQSRTSLFYCICTPIFFLHYGTDSHLWCVPYCCHHIPS